MYPESLPEYLKHVNLVADLDPHFTFPEELAKGSSSRKRPASEVQQANGNKRKKKS